MIDAKDMSDILTRCDERYVKKDDCETVQNRVDKLLYDDDKRLAVIEYQVKVNTWLTTAIAGGIIALVIKTFFGG